jgi:glycosyltransferase involved in cell wall biosynthesis
MTNDATSTPQVSVIVATREPDEFFTRAVASVLLSDHPSFELVVVDQSLSDAAEAQVQPYLDDERLRYHRVTSMGSGAGRNDGIELARGRVLLFTDDDCEVPSDWIARMEACFDESERVGAVFCNVEAGPHDPELGFIPAYVRTDDALVTDFRGKCRARGIGAGMGFLAQALREVGGFDVMLGPGAPYFACVDGDAAVRTLVAGWWIFETAGVSVVHHGFRTWSEGKLLSKRSWFGIGAAYSKLLRSRQRTAALLLFYELWLAVQKPLARVLRFKRPQGAFQAAHLVRGFVVGVRTPVDRATLTFKPPD